MFNNISIKLKMALMVVVPVVVIFITLGMSSYNNYKEVQTLKSITQMVSFATKASELVHNLQKERGASAGFISSKGAKFSTELQSIRKDTDKALLEATKNYKDELNVAHLSQDLQTKIAKAFDTLSKIQTIRSGVDALNVAVAAGIMIFSLTD